MRKYEYDWVRVLAFALLIPYHTGMIFVSWGWHIKNAEISYLLEIFMTLTNRWRLPLLFFIAGIGSYYALRKVSLASFAKERVLRLFIPLVVGMFLVVPPQIYFERLQQGATFSYAEFYSSVFNFVPYPKGSFSWHHLWFVAYLFVYSIVSLPIFAFRHSAVGKKFSEITANFLSKGYWIYLVFLPALILHFFLDKHFPTTNNLIRDWANLLNSWLAFLVGYWFATDERFMEKLQEIRRVSLRFAVLSYVLLIFFWKSEILGIFSEGTRDIIYLLVNNGLGGFSILAIVGFAKQHLTFSNPFLAYANRAVYPFYIFHQTVIVFVGFYVIQLSLNLWIKFLIINILTFLITWALYEASRRTRLTCFLFGIKIDKKTPESPRPSGTA